MDNKPTTLVAMMLALALIGLLLMGARTWEYLIYIIETPTVKVTWDPSEGATSYNWRVIWIDPSEEFTQLTGTVSAGPVEIPRSRAGHFRLEVQACNSAGCSDWAASTTHGFPKAWILFWRQPKPEVGVE